MEYKSIIFFIIAILTLTYFVTFWQNRNRVVQFHMFGKEIKINLGLLTFGIFLDGALITAILIWLLVY
ncbi:hypothetical protein JW758_02390 [Candidatus Peregrinibacteria bacterium]|nr:hypothetical protein [Candidatus Peregrinibacteria bacterium]